MNGDRALAKKLKDGVQDLEKELNEANSKLKSAKNTVALVDVKLKNYVTLEDDLRTMPGSLLLKPIESLLKELKGHLGHEKRNGSKDLSKLAEDLQAKQFKDRIEDLEKELNETNSKLESANEIVPFIEKELKYFVQLPFPYRMDHREAGNEGVYQYLFLNFLDLFRLLNGQLGDGEHNGSEVKLLKNRIQDLEKELNEANSKLESANAKLTTANLERANERAAAAEKKLEDCHMRGAEKIHQWDLTTNLVAQCIKELEGRFKDRFECLENDLKDFFPWLESQPGDGECNCSEGESDEEKETGEDKEEEEDKEEDEDEDEDTVLVDGPARDGSPSPHS
ncbi:hypothetical protein HKI87_05g39230 [Chloropicon roscoffensis]|uniref:Uncharacterized protein n=1 Tax=Chloropicon roscoffensis TaxID=1461544 RepID=A0AAX4P8S0_9CHLO